VTEHSLVKITNKERIEQLIDGELPPRGEQPSSGLENVFTLQQIQLLQGGHADLQESLFIR